MTTPELKPCTNPTCMNPELYEAYKQVVHNCSQIVNSLLGIALKVTSKEEVDNALKFSDPYYKAVFDLIASKINTPDPSVEGLVSAVWQVLDDMYEGSPRCSTYAHNQLRVAIEPFLTEDHAGTMDDPNFETAKKLVDEVDSDFRKDRG